MMGEVGCRLEETEVQIYMHQIGNGLSHQYREGGCVNALVLRIALSSGMCSHE